MSDETVSRRSFFLVFVAFLMNAFLLVTAVSSVLALVDDTLLKSAMTDEFYGARAEIGMLNIVLLFIAMVALILVPHLPKLVLLPPVAVMIWQLIGAPGFAWSITDHASMAKLDEISLASIALAVFANRMTTGHWFLAASRLPFRDTSFVRTVIAMPIALFAIIGVGVGGLLAAIPVFIEQQSGGYLHFASDGLEVRETVLTKRDHTVHLVGMVHIGDPKFYRTLFRMIGPKALILAEGVTDREGRMKARPSYDNAARGLGLESQSEFQALLAGANRVDDASAVSVAPSSPVASDAQAPHVLFADIDVADLSPATLRFLEAVGTVFQAPTLAEAVQRYLAISTQFKDDEVQGVMEEIVHKRNQRVLAAFDKYESQYQVIYIPWGALHMPDLEKKMKARGYRIETVHMLPIAKYDVIWKGLSNSLQPVKSTAAAAAP